MLPAAAFSLRFHFSVSIVSLVLAFYDLMDVFQCEMTQPGVNVDHPLLPTAAIW